MKKISALLLTISLLFIAFEAGARSAADVVFYHYRASLENDTVDHLSLFPKESKIPHFPQVISENETDLAVLQRYYRDVSVAYKNYLSQNVAPKLAEYKEKVSAQRQNIHLTQARSADGKSQFSRSLTQGRGDVKGQDRTDQTARLKAVAYYSTTYKSLSDQSASLKKKADFYQELSETSEELYRGDIH